MCDRFILSVCTPPPPPKAPTPPRPEKLRGHLMGARQMNKNKKGMRSWAPERIRDVIIGRGGYLFVWLCDH